MVKLNGLDLFSGIGGISEGLKEWVRPIAYCESERYAQGVLLSRMQSGEIDAAPIWDDVRTMHKGLLITKPDIIYGGFPCQDISTAGRGDGLDGERSGLFYEIARLASEIRPRFIFLENVPAIAVRGLDRVLLELTALGYDCRWTIVSAKSVGAPHLRERWFLLAHASGESMRLPESGQWNKKIYVAPALENGPTTDTDCARPKRSRPKSRHESKQPFSTDLLEGNTWHEYAAFLLRVDHGLPHRSHRLKCLGNAVVPEQVKAAYKVLMGLSK